jgi:hypothetical protein
MEDRRCTLENEASLETRPSTYRVYRNSHFWFPIFSVSLDPKAVIDESSTKIFPLPNFDNEHITYRTQPFIELYGVS